MMSNTSLWSEEAEKIKAWWSELQDPHRRGGRAELRRAESPLDVLMMQEFRNLYFAMLGTRWASVEKQLWLAAVAGVLVHIETFEGHSFAEACALPKNVGDEGKKPTISELRFSQLLRTHSLDELYVRMRRTMKMLHGKANVISVADDILAWCEEKNREEKGEETKIQDRVLVRWGLDYYQILATPARKKQ
jgi:CRISPR system Cascade subunit CasB